jgi:hypothetical protein
MIDVCACDVKDKEKLSLFRHRWAEWLRWLSAESRHSIFNQVHDLLWFDTVFRTLNEARRNTSKSKSKKIGFNRPLVELLDRGFVSSQTLAIRKLTDPSFYHPKKSVFSLVRLIDDISNHLELFTREHYICHDGTKYSWLSHEKNGIDYVHWKTKHDKFDILSETTPSKRKRKDKLKKTVISKLRRDLKVCDNIRTYVNNFIAHASDPENRTNLTDEQKTVTLNKLDDCCKVIVQVTSFVGAVILYKGPVGGVSTPQFDQLDNLDKPMVTKQSLKKLYDFWDNRAIEVDDWERFDWKKYIKT